MNKKELNAAKKRSQLRTQAYLVGCPSIEHDLAKAIADREPTSDEEKCLTTQIQKAAEEIRNAREATDRRGPTHSQLGCQKPQVGKVSNVRQRGEKPAVVRRGKANPSRRKAG